MLSTTAVRRQIRNHGPALLPDGTDPDVGQQTNTDLHRSLLDLRGTRSCAERVLLAFGELRQTNIDLGLAGNARIVANAADPFDTPEQIVIREPINCVNSLAHWQIITESESIKEPRGRSRSQSYSQIALLHSHLFLHDQLTFADISGTDTCSHPHLHCVVPGGGLSPDGTRWISCQAGFFLPVRVLSRLFRRLLFLDYLLKAFDAGKLEFFSSLESLRNRPSFLDYLAPLREAEWVVFPPQAAFRRA